MAKNLDQIIDMIKNLNLQDDGINMNHKIKSIELDFCNLIKDEEMLSNSMDYMNEKVLEDCDASLKFAMLFSSRNFDSLAMHDTKVRCKMLNILEKNFANAESFRKNNKAMLYNSVTLLGEYYHRVRLADGSPIEILGESLLQLLIQEIEFGNGNSNKSTYPEIDLKLAKLILSQVTLNGSILRSIHKNELNKLLFYVRKNLIEQNNLETSCKALLLMTLDLYYNNFYSLTTALEEMYTKYLIEEEKKPVEEEIVTENTKTSISPVVPKTWSEQVIEENLYQSEQLEETPINDSVYEKCDSSSNIPEELEYQSLPSRPTRYDEDESLIKPPPRREYFPRRTNNRSISPQNRCNDFNQQHGSYSQRQHHNPNNNKYMNRNNRNVNRYSASFDDESSVRSEGGGNRFYNAGDNNLSRPNRHEMDNTNRDRISNPNRNNWDRDSGYHTFDSRHRSTSRNNQRDNTYNNNFNNNRNRNTFDRPPRFRNLDIPSWRNNSQDNKHNRSNSKGGDSRSSSINRTFPRNNRHSSFDNYNDENSRGSKSNLHQGLKTEHFHYNNGPGNENRNFNQRQTNENLNGSDLPPTQRPQHTRNFGRSNNERYGSNYSLNSGDSTNWQHRGRQKNRNSYRRNSTDWTETQNFQENETNSETKWDESKGNNEIVKNARNTTKYMQYLSQKN